MAEYQSLKAAKDSSVQIFAPSQKNDAYHLQTLYDRNDGPLMISKRRSDFAAAMKIILEAHKGETVHFIPVEYSSKGELCSMIAVVAP